MPNDFEESDQMGMEYELSNALSAQLIRLMKQLDTTVAKLTTVQVDLAELAVKYEHTMGVIEGHTEAVQKDRLDTAARFSSVEARITKLESFVWRLLGGATTLLLLVEWFFKFNKS